MNRLSVMTDAANKTETYQYNKASKMIGKKDRNGVMFSYTYDENDRLLTETSGSMVYNYTYDALGNMKTMTDKTGTTTFEYDNLSRLMKKVFPTKDVVSYTYDAEGNQRSIQSGTNHKIEYFYDNMNRLEVVAWDGGNTKYQYDKNGNQSQIIHSNGMKSSYTFDGRNLLKGIVNHNPDGTKQEYRYMYDAEGLLTQKVEPKGTTTYTYTDIQQLDTMTEPNGRVTTYTYDKAGNRKSQSVTLGDAKTTIDYTYNNQNRLTDTVENRDGTIIKTAYSYDANGNQTKVSEKNEATGKTSVDIYKYDELNQLIHIDGRDGSKSDYTYYGTGLRATKNVNNNTSVFIYDGKEILAEKTAEGTKTNIFGNNMIATTGTDTLYYQYNNHGDVVRVLDQSGTLKNEYDYDAFGNAITEKETVKNPYRYAGYYQDTESGLYYLRSRYYNPEIARFLTEDTASGKYTDPLSLNKYTYCHNQPVTGYDPDGYALHIVAGALIGAVVGAASSLYEQRKEIGTNSYSYKKYWGSVAEGAITGAVAAATCGASIATSAGGTIAKTAAKFGFKSAAKAVAKNAAIDAASGIVGNTANQLISSGGSSFSATQAITSGVIEALNIPGGEAGEKTAKKVGSELVDTLTEKLGKEAGSGVAEKAGSTSLTKVLTNSSNAGINSAGIDPYALMKEKGIPQTLSDAEVDAIKKFDLQMNANKGGSNPKVHGNSKLSTKPQHGYEIYNTETGDVVKTGISGQKLNLNGTSPRANSQVNKLNKSAGKNLYDSRIVATDMPNRLSALEWERENALRLWNERNSMSLHKRPRPWEE